MDISYSFKSALKSLFKERWINLLSIITVSSSLLIITLTIFFLYNIEIASNRLPERYSLTIYLKNNLSDNEINGIIDTIKRRNDVAELKYIPKEDALKELAEVLKDYDDILKGLDENPLSSSIDLKIKREFVDPLYVKKISDELKKISGIEDIYSGENIVESIHILKRSIRNMSIIIFVAISAGIVFVTYSTVKILFYRKKEEIEIFKLLGASRNFIRMPFLFEGAFIGLAGGLLAVLGTFIFYFAITYRLSLIFPLLKSMILPMEIIISLPIIGLLMGIAGSLIAIGRIRY